VALVEQSLGFKHPRRLFIGGESVEPPSPATFEVFNCSTDEVVATVAAAQSADVERAADTGRSEFNNRPWPRMTYTARAACVEKLAKRLEDLNDEFARIWSIDSGKVYKVVQPRICLSLSGAFRQYSEMAKTFPIIDELSSAVGHQIYGDTDSKTCIASL
jgi:betaine-aldehyde dehydrogenase